MRILFLTSRMPFPLSQADRMTIFYYLKYLSKKHEITLISFYEDDIELTYIEEFKEFLYEYKFIKLKRHKAYIRVIKGLFLLKPMQLSYYSSELFKNEIESWIVDKKFDIVYMHLIRMSYYANLFNGLPKILGMQISMGLNYKRMYKSHPSLYIKLMYGLEYFLIKNVEYKTAKLMDKVFLISNNDIDFICKGKKVLNQIQALPHGVDADYFKISTIMNTREEKAIIFTGKLAYPPNEDAVIYFIEEILPLVTLKHPETKFYCVGKDPSKKILKYRSNNIIITGFVQDIREYIERCIISVDPLRIGAGLQNKVIEAMSMSMPVVCTSIANEGIQAKSGFELIVRDDSESFANAICDLIDQPEQRKYIGKNARKFIERKYTWEYFLKKFENELYNI